jgi:trimeric autotransporter adhesin
MNASFGRGFRIDERRHLDLRVESNNFLNRVSFTRMGTTVNASNYGLATAAAGMRTVTLNLRLRF